MLIQSTFLAGFATPTALTALNMLPGATTGYLEPTDPFEAAAGAGAQNPQPPVLTSSGATLIDTFADDFYGRVHLVRSRVIVGGETIDDLMSDWERVLDLGNITEAQTFDFLVTNFVRTASRNVTDHNITNPDGLSITPASFPYVLNPWDDQLFTLNVDLDGPPKIDAQLSWVLTGGQTDLLFDILGDRTVIFPFRPQVPLVEELRYKTDVLVSRSGIEQRASAWVTPRVVYGMDYMTSGPERTALINRMFGWHALFAVPMWHEAQRINSALSIGASSISINSAAVDFRDFGDSKLGILWRAWNDFEVITILSRTDATLTLERPLEQAHPLGTLIMPLRFAYLSDEMQAPRYRVGPQRFRAEWHSVDGKPQARLAAATPLETTTYQGLTVVLGFNYVTGALAEEFIQGKEQVDGDGGGFIMYGNRFAPENRTTKTFIVNTLAEKWALHALLHRFQGRRVSFWLPTFGADLELIDPLGSASTGFTARLTDYARFVDQQSPRRDIIVFRRSTSTPLIRRIIASADVGNNEEDFTVDSAWGVDVPLSDVLRVSFLHRVRFDSDVLTIEHEQSQADAVLEVPIVEVIE